MCCVFMVITSRPLFRERLKTENDWLLEGRACWDYGTEFSEYLRSCTLSPSLSSRNLMSSVMSSSSYFCCSRFSSCFSTLHWIMARAYSCRVSLSADFSRRFCNRGKKGATAGGALLTNMWKRFILKWDIPDRRKPITLQARLILNWWSTDMDFQCLMSMPIITLRYWLPFNKICWTSMNINCYY